MPSNNGQQVTIVRNKHGLRRAPPILTASNRPVASSTNTPDNDQQMPTARNMYGLGRPMVSNKFTTTDISTAVHREVTSIATAPTEGQANSDTYVEGDELISGNPTHYHDSGEERNQSPRSLLPMITSSRQAINSNIEDPLERQTNKQ